MKSRELDQKILKNIGITAFIIFIIICLSSIYIVKEYLLLDYYSIRVQFNFVADLKTGADVRMTGGLRAGYVNRIYQKGSRVEAELYMEEKYKVREKASICLFTIGMMGERFIEIDQTERSGPYVKPGTVLTGNDELSESVCP